LITAGIVILADAAVTLAWKEPLSALYGNIKQSAAQDQLDELEDRFLADPEVETAKAAPDRNTPRQAERLATIFGKQIKNGEGIGRLEIPSIGIDPVVIEGTDTSDLQRGPGRYPETGLPGQGRTIGIAGHRTTYLAPFRDVAEIEIGDEVTLDMPYGEFTYTVEKTEVVEPTDVGVVDDTGSERLVLTACHPLYSAAQRYVVTAKLSDMQLSDGGTNTG
jgi:sortase A